MRIGDVATRAAVSVRALRYYEEQGLLASTRSVSGQRHYTEAAVERIKLIQSLYGAGLSSKTIADLLPCVDAQVSTPESRALLAAERDRIDRQIAELTLTRGKLDAIIEQTSRPNPHCDYTTEPADRLAAATDSTTDLSGNGVVIGQR